ncbi:hypothetical protein CsatB_028675 [Cannabis sativa]
MKAVPRRRNYADGSRWLRSGLATKNSGWPGASSSNQRRGPVVAPTTGGGINDQLMAESNQGEQLVGYGQNNSNLESVNKNKSQISGEAFLRKEKVGDEVDNSNDGLVFCDSKRKRVIEGQVSGPIGGVARDVGLPKVGPKVHGLAEEDIVFILVFRLL